MAQPAGGGSGGGAGEGGSGLGEAELPTPLPVSSLVAGGSEPSAGDAPPRLGLRVGARFSRARRTRRDAERSHAAVRLCGAGEPRLLWFLGLCIGKRRLPSVFSATLVPRKRAVLSRWGWGAVPVRVLNTHPTAPASETKPSLGVCWSEDPEYEFSLPVKPHAGGGESLAVILHCLNQAWSLCGSTSPRVPLCPVCTPGSGDCSGPRTARTRLGAGAASAELCNAGVAGRQIA